MTQFQTNRGFRQITRFRPDSALTTEQDKQYRDRKSRRPTAKISRFRLRAFSGASSNELAVTPPEFPSPTSENMDLSCSKSPIQTGNTESRLTELEVKLASQEAKNTQMLDALNTTLRLLATMTQNQQTALPQTQLASTPVPRVKLDLKPSPPPNFDGDRLCGTGEG